MIAILQARDRETEYFFQLHLDDSKMIDDPDDPAPLIPSPDDPEKKILDPDYVRDQIPDPRYVREYHWGKDVPLATIKRETKLLAAVELAKVRTPVETTLSIEGKEL